MSAKKAKPKLQQASLMNFFKKTPSKSTSKERKEEDKENDRIEEPSPKATFKSKLDTTPNKVETPTRKKLSQQLKRARIESDDDSDGSPVRGRRNKIQKKAFIESDDEDDEEVKSKSTKKKSKKEDSDFEMDVSTHEDEDSIASEAVSSEEMETEDGEEDTESPAKKKPVAKSRPTSSKTPRKSNANTTIAGFASFAADDDDEEGADQIIYEHEKLEWLKPDKMKDKDGYAPDDPEYDPTTLKVPESFIKNCTPGMGNWWKIKSRNFDTVIFYKVGKFYELYHMDAGIGVSHCGLTFMRGKFAHSGFPEMRFEHFASMLLNKGYKVARVEQTETQEKCKERQKASLDWKGKKKALDKFEKQTRREVCRVETPGTRTADFSPSNDLEPTESFLASVYEEGSFVGVTLIDISRGILMLGQFEDDVYRTNLRTLFAHRQITQILFPKTVSETLLQIVETCLTQACRDVRPVKKFISVDQTTKFIRELETEEIKMDNLLKIMSDHPVGVRAFGGLITELKRYEQVHEVIRTVRVDEYKPPTSTQELPLKTKDSDTNRRMILDAMTLMNLDVCSNQSETGDYGSLLKNINKCTTSGGKRLMRFVVTSPPTNKNKIQNEQEIIKLIMNDESFRKTTKKMLSKLPDLERFIAKFGMLSFGMRPSDHPEKRAVFYEDILYNRQKTQKFCYVLESFQNINEWKTTVQNAHDIDEKLKTEILGCIPDMTELLESWEENFDIEKAKKAGNLTPKPGTNAPFDKACLMVKATQASAEEFRESIEEKYGYGKLVKSGKMHFTIEVRENTKAPSHWLVQGKKKGFKRFINDELETLNADMERYLKEKDFALNESSAIIFKQFFDASEQWREIVKSINKVDVRLALANYSSSLEVASFPEFVDEVGVLEIEQGRHPTVEMLDFVPNDTKLEVGGKCILLTGPNMGGKSTILRQVGLITLLAHCGCAVPAESMRLSVVDRIFTRLGASDRLLKGESTFMVEMTETASILKNGTAESLMLIDELGRGTSTSDGTSIAMSVLEDLSKRKIRTLFSTHYHKLANSLPDGCVSMHMKCHVEKNENGNEEVVFLYQLGEGAASKSHGFNAAKMAGLPDEIIDTGIATAKELEILHVGIQFIKAMKNNNLEDAALLLKNIEI